MHLLSAAVCLCAIGLLGCESASGAKGLAKATVSVDELQTQLDEFEELFTSRTKSAAAEIDRLSQDPRVKKMTLLWRSRSITSLQNIREQPQPMLVLVDSWLLCIRLRNFIETGEAGSAFGQYQPIALDTVRELEGQIEDLAKKVIQKDLFDQTAAGLNRLAAANPIQSGFGKTLMYGSLTKSDEPGVFQSLINIPLSPVRALEGVDRTPSAIYEFSNTTRHVADVLQELPESTRWQLLLLLYDLEETEMARTFLQSLGDIADSSDRLSQTAEHVASLLEDTEQNQEQLRLTLAHIDATAANLQALLGDVQQTAAAFSQTAQSVDSAAASWAGAAQATSDLVGQFKPSDDQQTAQGGDKMDVKETADAVRMAAEQIQSAGTALPQQTAELMQQLRSLVKQITLSIAFLLVLILCLAALWRLIKHKLTNAAK